MTPDKKLYVLVRGDLTPGQQATQAAHAAFRFAYRHPLATADWLEGSEYLILLQVPDEMSLVRYAHRAILAGIETHVQCEPDMGGAPTAVAIAPSDFTSRMCAQLPLALKEDSAMV